MFSQADFKAFLQEKRGITEEFLGLDSNDHIEDEKSQITDESILNDEDGPEEET